MGVVMKNRAFIKLMNSRLDSNCKLEVGSIGDIVFTDEEKKEISYWIKHFARHVSRFGYAKKMRDQNFSISKRLMFDFGLTHLKNNGYHTITIHENSSKKHKQIDYRE